MAHKSIITRTLILEQTSIKLMVLKGRQVHQEVVAQELHHLEIENGEQVRRGPAAHREQRQEFRRAQTPVKPTKMNMAEFEGYNTESWIQTMDLYFCFCFSGGHGLIL